MKVTIVPTGTANLASVLGALARVGAGASVAREPADLAATDAVVLPGVGSFASARQVALAHVAAAERAPSGECYLLVGDSAPFLTSVSSGIPSTKSIVKKGAPWKSPTSWTATMFGCRNWADARASWRNCSVCRGVISPRCGTLTATIRSKSASWAFQTVPNAPVPNVSTRSK